MALHSLHNKIHSFHPKGGIFCSLFLSRSLFSLSQSLLEHPSPLPILLYISSKSTWKWEILLLFHCKNKRGKGRKKMKHEKKPDKIVRITTILGQVRCREVNVPNLLIGEGKCSTARWGRCLYPCVTFSRSRSQFSSTALKIILCLPLRNEKHLMWEKKPKQNTSKQIKLDKQSGTEIL